MRKQPDYSHRFNWMHAPRTVDANKPVDAFFAYPTVYSHPNKKEHHLMPIGNPVFRTAARISTWWHDRFLASTCRIFAPYYRQMGMESLWMRDANFEELSEFPYADLRNAFFYYLKNWNKGRPFILAAHSQGSEHLIRLICEEFGELPDAARFIAGYLPGYSVTHAELARYPHVRLASAADDLGTIITYNTTGAGFDLLPVVRPGAVCVNPLNWTQTSAYAPKSLNMGSVLIQFGKFAIEKQHFTGAQVDPANGTLWIDADAARAITHSPLRVLNPILIHLHSIHTLDIALFQRNLEENVRTRCEAFLALHEKAENAGSLL